MRSFAACPVLMPMQSYAATGGNRVNITFPTAPLRRHLANAQSQCLSTADLMTKVGGVLRCVLDV